MSRWKMGCVSIWFLASLTACSSSFENTVSSSTSQSKVTMESIEAANNTELTVGKQLFSVNLPDFNLMVEGDLVDRNGNTWVVFGSEQYPELWLQLTLQNKASSKAPDSYELEELGLTISSTVDIDQHGFQKEQVDTLADGRGGVYRFETEVINGALLFFSKHELTSKEKDYFKNMVESINVTESTEDK